MRQAFKNRRYKMLLSYFFLAIAVIAAYKVILEIDVIFSFVQRVFGVISPFAYGFLVAYILNIPCGGIQRLITGPKSNAFVNKKKRMLSIIITYLLMFLTIYLILRLVIPSIYQSIMLFALNFNTYYNGAQDVIKYINDLNILNISLSMESILSFIRNFGMEKLPSSISALFGVSTALFKSFLTFVSSVYILIEKDNFKKYLCRLLKAFSSDSICEMILKYSRNLNQNCKQYIYTQTIDGLILGTIATIELYLLGSPYALILGIMLGIVNYIPYFGSIIGSLVAIVIVGFTQGLPRAAITAVVLLITQQIDGNVIQPKLMGGSFSLSPLLVIVSITVGGAFYGVLGMIIAIPIVAVGKNMLEEIVAHYEKKKAAAADPQQTLRDGNKVL